MPAAIPAPRVAPEASRLIGDPAPVRPALSVEVIDRGREPRRLLRYGAAVAQRQRLHFETRWTTEAEFSGKRESTDRGPDTEAWLEIEVLAASADRLDCQVRFLRGESIGKHRKGGQSAEHRRALDWLRGPLVRFSADRRGVGDLPAFELPPAMDRDVDLDLAWYIASYTVRSVVPLPEEPVGIGARWRIGEEDRRAVSGRRITDLELTAVRGRRVELSVSRSFLVPPQLLSAQRSYVIGVSRIQSSSHGRAVLDLDRLHPVEWLVETQARLEGVGMIVAEEMPIGVLWSVSESGSGR